MSTPACELAQHWSRDHHYRRCATSGDEARRTPPIVTNWAKTVDKGGSETGDKLSVVVVQSSGPTLFRSKDEN